MTTFRGPPPEAEPGIGALTIGGLLTETVARHREREAIAFPTTGETVRWTYGELESEARRVASALLAVGAGKGTRVGVLLGNRPEWVAAAFGVALAGGVLVPVNTLLEPPELDHVLRHSDTAVLITQEQLAHHRYVDELAGLAAGIRDGTPGELRIPRFPSLRRIIALGGPSGVEPWPVFLSHSVAVPDNVLDAVAAEVAPADDALLIYTSGTTALPKGVLHAQRGPALQSWRFAQQLRFDETVRSWSAFPFFWSAGFVMVMGATLAAGGTLVLEEHFEPGQALAILEAERVTSPTAWAHQMAVLEDHPDWPRRDLSAIRHVEAFTSFGRHPSVQVADVWSPRAAYGLSETCTIVTSLPADTPREEREGHQGVVLPGNALRILDPVTGDAAPAGITGEIAVKGPTLMKAYLKALPETCFDEDGFFHTGDAGFVDDQNRLHWTGRINEMIKTGGANVSPVEIETVLLHHPGLKVALAVGVPHETLGEMVVVCAVAHDGATVDEGDVRAFLRGQTASYKIPRRVLFFDETELSVTGNAKIRAEDLRRLAIARLKD